MAITKTVEFKGLTVKAAYIRVAGVNIPAGNTRITFCVSTMAERDSESLEISYEECDYSLEGGNPVRQAYDYLKTLEKYAGSEDC